MIASVRRLWLAVLMSVAVVSLTACAGAPASSSWPGVTVDGNIAYIAFNQKVYAVDLATKASAWKDTSGNAFTIGDAGETYYGEPAVIPDSGGRVVVGGYTKGLVYAFDPIHRWTFTPNTGEVIPGLAFLTRPTGNIAAGAAVAGKRAYVGYNNGGLYAVNTDDGTPAWQFRTEDGSGFWSRPVVQDGVLYVTSLGHTLYALDAATGKLNWSFKTEAPLAGSPLITGTVALFGTFGDKVIAVDTTTHQARWERGVDGWVWGTPQVYGDTVYAGTLNGTVYALRLSDGTVDWSMPADPQSVTNGKSQTQIRAPLLVTADSIYVATRNVDPSAPHATLFALDRKNGSQRWAAPKVDGGEMLSQPQLWGQDRVVAGVMYSDNRAAEILFVYGTSDGKQVWAFKP